MAPPKADKSKRKRTTTKDTPNKRRRTTRNDFTSSSSPASSAPQPTYDSQEYFEAIDILDERIRNKKLEYYIDWAGIDPATGEPYEPTWEPASNANAQLVASWNAKKPTKTDQSHRKKGRLTKAQGNSRNRRARAQNDDQSSTTTRPSKAYTPASETLEDFHSSTSTSPIGKLPSNLLASHVEVVPPANFVPDIFERFSQLPTSQSHDTFYSDQIDQTSSSLPLRTTVRRYPSSGVVPDSDSEDGSDNYNPPTEPSSSANETTNSEGSVAHFTVPHRNNSRAASTAPSIPETEIDPIEDSQAHSQSLTIPREIPDTFGSIASFPHLQLGSTANKEVQATVEETPAQAVYSLEDVVDQTIISNTTGEASQPQSVPDIDGEKLGNSEESISSYGVLGPLVRIANDQDTGRSSNKALFPNTEPRYQGNHQQNIENIIKDSSRAWVKPKSPEYTATEAISRPTQFQQSLHKTYDSLEQIETLSEENLTQGPGSSQGEQNAQIVPDDLYYSTPEPSTQSILPTTEKHYEEHPESPNSRHDSSQQSPEPIISTHSVQSSSSVPRPPTQSLETFDSNQPPRPEIPDISSSAANEMSDEIKKSLDELFRKTQEENPYVPKPRLLKSTASPSTGTRSPSIIPDRSPAAQAPTSLRTIALANSSQAVEPVAPSPPLRTRTAPPNAEPKIQQDMNFPGEIPVQDISSDRDSSDDDDDTESLLNDDLQLLPEEYVVPLHIDGRQRSMYHDEFRNKMDIIQRFLTDPQTFSQAEVAEVEAVTNRLRDLETHIDLLYVESGQADTQSLGPLTQAQWSAQWATENSSKFRFLGALIHDLRDHDIHLVLALEHHDERLFDLVETFLKGNRIYYKFALYDRRAVLTQTEGLLKVTVLVSSETPVIEPPDAIICLNGTTNGAQIRALGWSRNLGRSVPIIHLVIPRSVGHIERYVAASLEPKKHLHTVLASLAHVRDEIGRPISSGTPRPHSAADQVAEFLVASGGPQAQEWPLPSVGSIKDLIEYQSQQSQDAMKSPTPTPGPNSASKRPLDEDNSDPSKRMRFTPQPGSSGNNEITRISDSMPGTAAENSKLHAQIAELQRLLEKERTIRREQAKHHREQEASWDKRQNDYEDLQRSHRLRLGESEQNKKIIDRLSKNKDIVQERYNKGAAETRELQSRYERLEGVHLASNDEKILRIAQLEKELAEARKSEQLAAKRAQTADETLEYTKEQYRLAQERATELAEQNAVLKAKLDVAEVKATGEIAALKRLNTAKVTEGLMQRVKGLESERSTLVKTLQSKEDEISRLKSGRGVGVGTRAQSVGPKTPRPGSRAASPITGHRVANLRNA